VASAQRAGALGARLTGAGWGGAALVLLGKGKATRGAGEARVIRAITRAFQAAYGREPAISVVSPSGGVRREAVR
jgi:galactokinase